MGLLKTAIIGAAVYAGFKYLTKKDPATGKSIVDDVKEKAPEWMEKAKDYKREFDGRSPYAGENLGI
ncbi:YtxH domain-containing protein [Pedobacter endophyticus]|uniref:YtxH domain-containing protein n=1 Tax=Pedobacter endophyticus TaxID=2789740 RepID=A0A7S9L0H0_9SPHI|nr:YtxH domain-containing protein [Pedobacter endophyticus]QPH40197.1 YtxH domain-containing protein [Pedobacter endophyticus]